MKRSVSLGGLLVFGSMLVSTRAVEGAWTLTLQNETGRTLTRYVVHENPPPTRLPGGTLSSGGTLNIDPAGYNPVLAWPGGVSPTGTAPNGLFLGLGLSGSPALIQYKVFHYKVTPGTAGSDPALQPVLVRTDVVEVDEGELLIHVDSDWNVTIGAPSACCHLGTCSAAVSAAACAGNFHPGEQCTGSPCVAASETIGPAGGTVATDDGGVSVEFPPGCLAADTTITIEDSDLPAERYNFNLIDGAGTFDVHVAYRFEPADLEFCEEAELCMRFDRTAYGISPAGCGSLRIIQRDLVCGSSASDPACETDADCPAGVACRFVFLQHRPTCDCPASSATATCCVNIDHFSDYMAATAVRAPCVLRRCWCCGRGIVLFLPLMLGCLGLMKRRVRRRGGGHLSRRM